LENLAINQGLTPGSDAAVLQAGQYILRQPQFPGAEQVGIDIRQYQRGGDDLAALPAPVAGRCFLWR